MTHPRPAGFCATSRRAAKPDVQMAESRTQARPSKRGPLWSGWGVWGTACPHEGQDTIAAHLIYEMAKRSIARRSTSLCSSTPSTPRWPPTTSSTVLHTCLLYTSDAADDL